MEAVCGVMEVFPCALHLRGGQLVQHGMVNLIKIKHRLEAE